MRRGIWHRAANLVVICGELACGLMILAGCALAQGAKEPPYVDPGPPGGPPSDATVLLDRKDPSLDAWQPRDGWEIDGAVLRAPRDGERLVSRVAFGDVQLHVEFRALDGSATHAPVWLHGRYEVPGSGAGKVVKPGRDDTAPPADAVALFDGTTLSEWIHPDGRPAQWQLVDGVLRCRPGSGNIITKTQFGSVQLHVEFATPYMPRARGQGRGNSGVYVQGRYEIQVLDSYKNRTYFTGQCAAIYGQYPPLVNACRPPRQWQTYDILFTAPECDDRGNVRAQGRMTVFHNGVLVHDDVALRGPTGGALDHNVCQAGPLMLQDHGNLVQFRNIWLRHLDNGTVALAPRDPGQWQSYDIVFRAPRVGADGRVLKRGRITVLHNGVLIRDRVPVGPQVGERLEKSTGPVALAAGPFEYRNIWIRAIERN